MKDGQQSHRFAQGSATDTQILLPERSSPEDSKIGDDEDRYRFIGVIDDTDNTSNEMLGERKLGRQDVQTTRQQQEHIVVRQEQYGEESRDEPTASVDTGNRNQSRMSNKDLMKTLDADK